MDKQLKAQLGQTINIKSPTSAADNYGKATLGAAVAIDARVVLETVTIETSKGMEEVTKHIIVTEDEITEADYIWLPGESAATAALGRKPSSVTKAIDENGDVDYYITRV